MNIRRTKIAVVLAAVLAVLGALGSGCGEGSYGPNTGAEPGIIAKDRPPPGVRLGPVEPGEEVEAKFIVGNGGRYTEQGIWLEDLVQDSGNP